jgi:hypothetical protein
VESAAIRERIASVRNHHHHGFVEKQVPWVFYCLHRRGIIGAQEHREEVVANSIGVCLFEEEFLGGFVR